MEKDGRGFGFLEPFTTRYHGDIRIKESSAVHPCIWLFAENAYGSGEAPVLHLTHKDAKELHAKLGQMLQYTEARWEEDFNV